MRMRKLIGTSRKVMNDAPYEIRHVAKNLQFLIVSGFKVCTLMW